MVKYKSSKILFNMQQDLFILLHLQIINICIYNLLYYNEYQYLLYT